MVSGLIRRVIHGVGANAFSQAINILIQIVSVPLYLHYWSIEAYGYWVMLSAAPAYFSMADAGVVSVAMNRMTMLSARGERNKADELFSSVLLFVGVVVVTLGFIAGFGLVILDESLLKPDSWKISVLCLICCTLISMAGNLFDAVFRASNKYASGVYALNSVRLLEWIGGMIGLVVYKAMVFVAVGMLVGRLFGSIALYIYTKYRFKDFTWSLRKGRFDYVREMIIPALGFMAFPIGNAISIQGMTVLVGFLFGPAFLAIFSAYRTVSRSIVQLVAILSHSLWPEFSGLYGAEKFTVLRNVYSKSTVVSSILAVSSGVSMFLIIPYVLQVWTHGKIEYIQNLSLIFVVTTIVAGIWHVPRILLLSTNNHISISMHYIAASLGMLVFTWAGWQSGSYIALLAMPAFEIYMWFVSYKGAQRVLCKADLI